MLNSSARIGWSVSGGKPADTPLSARRMKFFTTAFELGGHAVIGPEKYSSGLSSVLGPSILDPSRLLQPEPWLP